MEENDLKRETTTREVKEEVDDYTHFFSDFIMDPNLWNLERKFQDTGLLCSHVATSRPLLVNGVMNKERNEVVSYELWKREGNTTIGRMQIQKEDVMDEGIEDGIRKNMTMLHSLEQINVKFNEQGPLHPDHIEAYWNSFALEMNIIQEESIRRRVKATRKK